MSLRPLMTNVVATRSRAFFTLVICLFALSFFYAIAFAQTASTLVLTPSTVAGSVNSVGKITLSAVAPIGGTVVTLSSGNTTVATVPASVTVPAAANSVEFVITTFPTVANATSLISATAGGIKQSATLTVSAAAVSSVAVNPSSVLGGNSSTGTVTLTGKAPSGGLLVTLNKGSATAVSIPTSVTVAANSTTATFPITTVGVSTSTNATISAAAGGVTKQATLTVTPIISALSFNSSSVVGGVSSTGTVTLTSAAPTGGRVVTLDKGSATAVSIPASVTVAAGSTTATFTATTTPVAASTAVSITASTGGSSKAGTLTVTPPTLNGVSLNPSGVQGGVSSTGTVTLSGSAPSAGVVVALSSNSSVAMTPANVTVPAGETSKTFTISTTAVGVNTSAIITASLNGTRIPRTLNIYAPTSPNSGTGLKAEYYSGTDLISDLKLTRKDPTIDFQWYGDSPAPTIPVDDFSVRWSGFIEPSYSETYTFILSSDDGSRLWINGQLLVDGWGGPIYTSATIALVANQRYSIKMEFRENTGGAGARLWWSSPRQPEQIVPQSRLYPALPSPLPPDAPTFSQITATTARATLPAFPLHATSLTLQQKLYDDPNSAYVDVKTDLTSQAVVDITGLLAATKYSFRCIAVGPDGKRVGLEATLTTTANPQPMGQGTGVRGSYYRTLSMTDANFITSRIEPNIDFSWGTGSPGPIVPVDNFSARWVGKIQPAFTETYTFYAKADEGVRVWINGHLIIDRWNQTNFEANGNITLVAGHKYDIAVDYMENFNHAYMTLSWSSNSQAKQIVPQTALYPAAEAAPLGTGTGLRGNYYNNIPGFYTYLPPTIYPCGDPNRPGGEWRPIDTPFVFTSLTLSRVDPTINLRYELFVDPPPTQFGMMSVRWTGQIEARYSETYTFHTESNDGVRLWINGQKVIDNWTLAPVGKTQPSSGNINLVAGQKYNINLEFFDNGTGIHDISAIRLLWESPSQVKEIIPSRQLYPTPRESIGVGDGSGLSGRYYKGANHADFRFARKDATLDFDWSTTPPSAELNGDFSARWWGTVLPRHTETYNFHTASNDSVRVWVNHQLVIDGWAGGGVKFNAIALTAGVRYPIMVEYRHRTSLSKGAKLQLSWSSPSQLKQVIPQSQLDGIQEAPPLASYGSCFTSCPSDCPEPPKQMQGVFISQDVPSTMVAGQSYPVSIKLRNTGTKPWVTHGTFNGVPNHHYLAQLHNEGWSDTAVNLPHDILPNEEVTFNFNVTAPTTPAVRNLSWGIGSFNNGGWGRTPRIIVDVVAPPVAPSLDPPLVKDRTSSSVQLQMPRLTAGVTNLRLQRAARPLATPVALPAVDLLTWLRADKVEVTKDGKVSQWNDATVLNNDAAQSNIKFQPRWVDKAVAGRPVVRFDGVDDELVLPYKPPSNDFTVFAVIRSSQPIRVDTEKRGGWGSQRYLFNPDYVAAWNQAGAGLSVGTNGMQSHEHSDYHYPTLSVYNGNIGPDFVVVGFMYRNKQPLLWLNGVLADAGTFSTRAFAYMPTRIGGGTAPAGYAETAGFEGDVAEVIGYKSNLTDIQAQNVATHLMSKYDIATTPVAESNWQTIAIGLQSEALYTDNNVAADMQYFYRCVADGPNGLLTSRSVGAHTLPLPPAAPAAPSLGAATLNSVPVTAPALPARAHAMALQRKLGEEPVSAFTTQIYMTAGETATVTGLLANRTYNFRCVALGEGGQTAGSVASVTTGQPLPDPPAAPQIQSVRQTGFSVIMPPRPARATSLSLQYKAKHEVDSPYVTASSGRLGGETVAIDNLNAGWTYSVRCVAIGGGGSTAGSAIDIRTNSAVPGVAAAPQFSDVGVTTLTVTAPLVLPDNAVSLTLQSKMVGQNDQAYDDLAFNVKAGEAVGVDGLASDVTYVFRYMAVGEGGNTPGISAQVTTRTAAIAWGAGTPISCIGIRSVWNGLTVSAGSRIKLSSALATDFDVRQVTVDGQVTTKRYSDPCTYAWSASGGTFVNSLTTGQSVEWIAPQTPGTSYTFWLQVDDQNSGNKPGIENGSRDDKSQGFNDDPVRFKVTVKVQ